MNGGRITPRFKKEKNMKIRMVAVLTVLFILIVNAFASCNANDPREPDSHEPEARINHVTDADPVSMPQETAGTDPIHPPKTEPLRDNFSKIRFGETEGILLLDVEWYTFEEYIEEVVESLRERLSESEIQKMYGPLMERMRAGETYAPKTINGRPVGELRFSFFSASKSINMWNSYPGQQADPDGYFIYNIYPMDIFGFRVGCEREYAFYLDDIIAHFHGFLIEGMINQEDFDMLSSFKTPLEFIVRWGGWFDEADLINYPPSEFTFPTIPEPITGQNAFNILFIGNSFTFFGDVPGQLAAIALAYGITVTYDEITAPGATIAELTPRALEAIKNNRYDYVVMQDHSKRLVYHRTEFISDVELLSNAAAATGAIPVIYNTPWAEIGGVPDRIMQEVILTPVYRIAAIFNGAIMVNAADAWIYAYDMHPHISLYIENDYHANDAGAFLTACVFASTLFGIRVDTFIEGNRYTGEDALILGQAAWEFVTGS